MDYGSLYNQLVQYSLQLITLGGSINPYVGGAIALVITGLLIYLGYKSGQQKVAEQNNAAGQAVNANTGQAQQVTGNVLQHSDDFFKDGKK